MWPQPAGLSAHLGREATVGNSGAIFKKNNVGYESEAIF